ncbi:hypothetical protein Tco_0850659 [Tanacetum coccineum]
MPSRMRTRSAGRPVAESLGGGTGIRVGRGPREGNDERVDDLNGQGNDQGLGANRGVEGVNGNVKGVNGGVGNQGNVENQNGNVVNEKVQENVRNVLVNGNRVGCSYKEFLACNPKEYDSKGGIVVLTRWFEKMENVQDMSGCSVDQKVKYWKRISDKRIKNEAKNDKTEHGIEKRENTKSNQSQSPKKSKSKSTLQVKGQSQSRYRRNT